MKQHNEAPTSPDGMRSEYDFEGVEGIRGKYYQRYRQGHTVRVHREDGSTTVQHFRLEDGAVMLDPDVRPYFPDSDAVNRALRGLIELAPRQPKPEPSKA
jgi:hypothetical protein